MCSKKQFLVYWLDYNGFMSFYLNITICASKILSLSNIPIFIFLCLCCSGSRGCCCSHSFIHCLLCCFHCNVVIVQEQVWSHCHYYLLSSPHAFCSVCYLYLLALCFLSMQFCKLVNVLFYGLLNNYVNMQFCDMVNVL